VLVVVGFVLVLSVPWPTDWLGDFSLVQQIMHVHKDWVEDKYMVTFLCFIVTACNSDIFIL